MHTTHCKNAITANCLIYIAMCIICKCLYATYEDNNTDKRQPLLNSCDYRDVVAAGDVDRWLSMTGGVRDARAKRGVMYTWLQADQFTSSRILYSETVK